MRLTIKNHAKTLHGLAYILRLLVFSISACPTFRRLASTVGMLFHLVSVNTYSDST